MSDKVQCPVCNNKNLISLSKIDTNEIVSLYKKNKILIEGIFDGTPFIYYLRCINCDLRFFNPSIAGNEIFYNQLQELNWYFLHDDKTEFAYAKELVQPNQRVLDVGSGRGVWASYLKIIPGVFYQGIEFSSKSIELANKDGVNVIKESIEDHAGKFAGYYDMVVAFQVLEHIDNIQTFISACLSCIKPGGNLIIAVPNNEGFLKKMTNNWLNIPPHHINHWNENSLRKLGEKFQLKIKHIYKESITPVHKLLFYNVDMSSKLGNLLGVKNSLVNNSLKFRVINKIGFWLAKIIMPFSKAHLRNDGHTIIVVFEK
jgi:2-polyprenyl-3-methyl-5-hydroxy-6-metoxy-1,4-benzoquinol methylase